MPGGGGKTARGVSGSSRKTSHHLPQTLLCGAERGMVARWKEACLRQRRQDGSDLECEQQKPYPYLSQPREVCERSGMVARWLAHCFRLLGYHGAGVEHVHRRRSVDSP